MPSSNVAAQGPGSFYISVLPSSARGHKESVGSLGIMSPCLAGKGGKGEGKEPMPAESVHFY